MPSPSFNAHFDRNFRPVTNQENDQMPDVTFHADLSPAELGTVRLALIAWRSRAEREAAVMEKFGATDTLDRARATANARASRTFVREADALLAKLQPGVIRSTVSPERLARVAEELLADADPFDPIRQIAN